MLRVTIYSRYATKSDIERAHAALEQWMLTNNVDLHMLKDEAEVASDTYWAAENTVRHALQRGWNRPDESYVFEIEGLERGRIIVED